MAKRKIATGRKRGHILRMAEDVKTWREVSRALGSIRTEMRIYVGVATAAFVFGASSRAIVGVNSYSPFA